MLKDITDRIQIQIFYAGNIIRVFITYLPAFKNIKLNLLFEFRLKPFEWPKSLEAIIKNANISHEDAKTLRK
jgi:hypothetical protein